VKISLIGWRKGLRKIQLVSLLRKHCGYTLSEAKRQVDKLLSGSLVAIEIDESVEAQGIAKEIQALGVILVIGEGPQDLESHEGC